MKTPNIIFVFGSNLAGRHGKGAALFALENYGAVYGKGIGRTGRAYAIPTKDGSLNVLNLKVIKTHVEAFIVYALANPDLTFLVTRIGCGLAGYDDSEIAPFFKNAPSNCTLPIEWNHMQTVDPWATKYRPKHFEDMAGQANAIARLQGTIKRKALPNAIMLTGPSGTGKTTLARIFARYINCKTHNACGKCPSCLLTKHPDIDESNAADARGIDDVRALIAKAKYKPHHNVRVFIIDEAHQMTPQSLQAFLKPLEEPPKNTMYILCTTDPQKFPNTVLNRCLQLPLGLPSVEDIVARLRVITKAENQRLPKTLYTAIAEASGGHLREAVNLLENAVNLIATKPDIQEAELIETVSSTGGVETAQAAKKMLLGMYLRKPSVVAKAVFDMQDGTQTVNQALWFNEYYLAQLLKHDTRAVFHSPANRDFAAAARKSAPEAKIADILDAQRKLVGLRNQMHTVSTKEVSLMLAALS